MPTPIKPLKMMGVRQFRDQFPKLTEPVRVIRSTGDVTVLGVWTPDPSRVEKPAAEPPK